MHASKRFQRMLHLGQEIRDNNRKWRKKGRSADQPQDKRKAERNAGLSSE